MKIKESSYYPMYQAQVGALGSVTFWKTQGNSYCFTFFNGEEHTPLYLSEDAAYYVWAFIGCEHPDTQMSKFISSAISSPSKKAGRRKTTKKRPSSTTKKKAK